MKKRISFIAFAMVLFASIGFVISNNVTTDEVNANEELAYYTLESDVNSKCGDGKATKETKSKKLDTKAKSKDAKCGDGKCDDGKATKESKTTKLDTKANSKDTKCGDGEKEEKAAKKAKKEKCGDGK